MRAAIRLFVCHTSHKETILWAVPLFTVSGSTDTVTLGFRWYYMRWSCICFTVQPAWGIVAERIVIHNGAGFPNFPQIQSNIGSLTLIIGDQNHCTSLTRVHIPIDMALSFTEHWIEFANPSPAGLVEWVHIAEAKFYIYRLKFSSLIFINWYHLLFNNGNTLNPPIHHQCPSSAW